MQILRTLGWLACVVYSTIPLFWFMVHPRAHRWREKVRSPFRVLVPAWLTMWVGIGAITGHWRNVTLYSTFWTWVPAVFMFAIGIFLYSRSGAHFSWAQLGGLPEVRPIIATTSSLRPGSARACVIRSTWDICARCWLGASEQGCWCAGP